jgi:hypothetical protein
VPAPQIGHEPQRPGEKPRKEHRAQQARKPRHGGLPGIAHAVHHQMHLGVRPLRSCDQQGQRSGNEDKELDQFDGAPQRQADMAADHRNGIGCGCAEQRDPAEQGDGVAHPDHARTMPSAAMVIGGSPAFRVMSSI